MFSFILAYFILHLCYETFKYVTLEGIRETGNLIGSKSDNWKVEQPVGVKAHEILVLSNINLRFCLKVFLS